MSVAEELESQTGRIQLGLARTHFLLWYGATPILPTGWLRMELLEQLKGFQSFCIACDHSRVAQRFSQHKQR
eukprot:248904-Rhodomonas_salina.1